jgi:antitoxin component of RelBE/YafQ-DinJ toxin-antitoxin module
MKKFSEIGAFIFIFTIIASAIIAIIISGNRATHTHYVCLELNPRIEFLTDSDHKVKSIKPLNTEAKELIINEEFVGLTMSDACNKFLSLCAQTGYLKIDGTNNAIKLSVLSGLNQELDLKLSKDINNFLIKNNILGILIDNSQDLQQYKDAKSHGVCTEKYDLMIAVKENNPNISLDELKGLNNQQLIKKIEESHNNYILEYSEEDLNNKLELLADYKDIYYTHINSITHNSTREFKEKLKEYRAQNSKAYKINYQQKYNEWLFG